MMRPFDSKKQSSMHSVDLFQLKLKNGPFACRSFGQGEPLLFLHAGICDARMWKPQVDYFSKKYQVILCDLRGFGRSPLPPHRFAHHEDVAGLLDVLRLPTVTLIGASFGGRSPSTLPSPIRSGSNS